MEKEEHTHLAPSPSKGLAHHMFMENLSCATYWVHILNESQRF